MSRLMTIVLALILLCAVGFAADGHQQVLASFDYPDVEAARRQWQAAEESVPAELMEHGDGTALKMVCNFQKNDRRAVYDMPVDWDLSGWHRFSLQVYSPDPAAIGNMTVYFKSGDGWFRRGGISPTHTWQTIEFSRAEFSTEGEPSGWESIETMRIAAWHGAPQATFVAVDDFRAYRERIVLLTDTASLNSAEGRSVARAASRVSGLLEDKGIATGAIGDHTVREGNLGDFDIIIAAYNPQMSEEAAGALAQYVEDGGKLLCFYSLPGPIAEALHIEKTGWQQADYEGQFARIEFDTDALRGLSESMGQNSWNVTLVEPAEQGAEVIGRWVDSEGKRIAPAVTLSDTGAFMGHILTSADAPGQAQMLFALVTHFSPATLQAAADKAIEWPDRMGQLRGGAIIEWLKEHEHMLEDPALMREIMDVGRRISTATTQSRPYEAVNLSQERDTLLRQAYLEAQRPIEGEFRAVWEHSGQGAYADGWDKTMRVLADSGFNAIMPNTFWGGVAYYESEILPVADVVTEKGDQVAQAVEAGKRHGIEVHPWKVNFRLGRGTPEAFIDRMREQGRLQKTFSGEQQPWLCPSHPENKELEVASMVEVATEYDVAGVHFDYIRYPGSNNCYCEGCRRRFEEDTGVEIENWPEDTRKEGLHDRWIQWRAAQITEIVAETSRRIHQFRPECRVSAAVFRSYPGCVSGVGQDWVTWAREGYVDFLCPMDYTESDSNFAGVVNNQLALVDGAVPVYPGIGATSSSSTLPVDRVAGQINITRNFGTGGFIIFNYTASLGDTILGALGDSITGEQTYVPHYGPRFDFGLAESEGITRGVRLQRGEVLEGTVRSRLADTACETFLGDVSLRRPNGQIVRELGSISDKSPRLDYRIAAQEPGLYLISVTGEATSDVFGHRPFAARSMPIVVGGVLEGGLFRLRAER